MSLANGVIVWLLLSGIVTLATWSRLARGGLAPLAALNAVCAFICYNAALPAGTNIRVDLFLTIPLVLMIVVLALRRRPADGEQPPGRRRP